MSRYQKGDCVGKGASGTVYRALDLTTGQTVAIKQIQSNLPHRQLQEIMYEIDLLKQLMHVNIVQLYGFLHSENYLEIVMEYCEGGSLRHVIEKYGEIPERLVCTYIQQVLSGLCFLHDQGVIHRDIKSANILTTKSGQIKLADFGIAVKEGIDHQINFVGSPYWMAPEVIELVGWTSASDLWSVGCTAIELFTGSPPYFELDAVPALFRIVTDNMPPLPAKASKTFMNFLHVCFRRNPEDRGTAQRLQKHDWFHSSNAEPSRKKQEQLWAIYQDLKQDNDYSLDFEGSPDDKFKLSTQNQDYYALYEIQGPKEDTKKLQDVDLYLHLSLEKLSNVDQILFFLASKTNWDTKELQLFINLLDAIPSAPLKIFIQQIRAFLITEQQFALAIVKALQKRLDSLYGESKDEYRYYLAQLELPKYLFDCLKGIKRPKYHQALYSEVIKLVYDISLGNKETKQLINSETFLRSSLLIMTKSPRASKVELLKIIKNICQALQDYQQFETLDVIETFCSVLEKSNGHFQEQDLQIFISLYHILRLSPARQDIAIKSGILELLKIPILYQSVCAPFATPLLCDIVRHRQSFTVLWEKSVLSLLLTLLDEIRWKTQVEQGLFKSEFTRKIFTAMAKSDVELISGQMFKLISRSPELAAYFLRENVLEFLTDLLNENPTTQTCLKLLRLVLGLLHPSLKKCWDGQRRNIHNLVKIISNFKNNQSVLIRELANRIEKKLIKIEC